VNDLRTNPLVSLGRSPRQDVWLDLGKKSPLRGGPGEVSRDIFAGHIIRHDPLNRTHRSTGIGGALGHFLVVDATIEHRRFLVLEVFPRLAEDRGDLSLHLLR